MKDPGHSAKSAGGRLQLNMHAPCDLTYVALHEVTWCMAVWCTQNAPRRQQFHVAPAMPALEVHHFGGYSKMRYRKLVM